MHRTKLIDDKGRAHDYFEPSPGVYVPALVNAAYVGGHPNDPPVATNADQAEEIGDRLVCVGVLAMTADQWAARLLAIHAAKEAGDPLPFGILCAELAAMEAKATAPPLALTALTVITPETLTAARVTGPEARDALADADDTPKKPAKKVKPAKEE